MYPLNVVSDDIRDKLIARGIPAEEIAYIHDAKTEQQKSDLFDKVRNGEIRVLLGSTAKMGTGTNVQKRLIAVHDLDIPWRPADLEQRAGRIIRQGNENKNVQIFRYVTQGTFDAYSYQTLENKHMCSDAEIRQLISRIVLNERCPSTLDLLENLDKIHRLIGERQKIDFEYGKYDETTKQIAYYYKKREMLPVSVIYFHERFYLKCLNEKDRKWRIYRVDRMKNILGGEVSYVRLPPEDNYEGFVTDMFAPEYFTVVTLRVKKYLLDETRENFGDYASILHDEDADYVRIRVRVGINRKFYLWLMQYGDGVELVSPAKERVEYLEEVRKMLRAYPEFA